MKQSRLLHPLCCLSALLLVGQAAADDPPQSVEPVRTNIYEIRITAVEGCVAWSTVVQAVAETGRFDVSGFENLPDGSINLNDSRTLLGLLALNLALPEECSVQIDRGEDGDEPQLVITLDKDAALARLRDIQRQIRERIGEDAGKYGLFLDEGWENVSDERPLVVIVHGYNSSHRFLSGFHEVLQSESWSCGVFEYPNDGPLDESAALLALELAEFRRDNPDRRIAVVAHSMGGLVTRAVIENPELDPGNVRQLIMVATPNHGSQLAYFPAGLDWLEHREQEESAEAGSLLLRSTTDGLNEAALDLWPDSAFLHSLNDRERNSDVRYSLLIGTRGPLSEAGADELRTEIRAAIDESRLLQIVRPRIEDALEDLDEFIEEEGDGAVAVKRARLEGVDDTELLPFEHLALTRSPGDPDFDRLTEAILKRLEMNLDEEVR